MKRLSPIRLALFGMLASQAAVAAPFCIQSQVLPPQCIYNDAQQCDVAARQQNEMVAHPPGEKRLVAAHPDLAVADGDRLPRPGGQCDAQAPP